MPKLKGKMMELIKLNMNTFKRCLNEKLIRTFGERIISLERKLRRSGVVIVRNTLPPKEAVDLASSTIEYLYQNGAFPNSTSDNDVRDFLLKILSFSSILSSNYRKYKFKQAFF